MISFMMPGIITIGFFLILAKIFEKLGFGIGLSRFLLRIPIAAIFFVIILIDWYLTLVIFSVYWELIPRESLNEVMWSNWVLITAGIFAWMISYVLGGAAIMGSGGKVCEATQQSFEILKAKTHLSVAAAYISLLPGPIVFIVAFVTGVGGWLIRAF